MRRNFEAEAYRRLSLTPAQREKLDAKERAAHAAALDALARLLDLKTEPTHSDFKAVTAVVPNLASPLQVWIDRRLGPVKYATWLDALYPFQRIEQRAPKTATAPAIASDAPTEAPAMPSGALERDWPNGATVNELAEARGCTPQNVSKAIKRLRARNQLDGRDGQTRGHWPAEHTETIWAELKRNTRKRKT